MPFCTKTCLFSWEPFCQAGRSQTLGSPRPPSHRGHSHPCPHPSIPAARLENAEASQCKFLDPVAAAGQLPWSRGQGQQAALPVWQAPVLPQALLAPSPPPSTQASKGEPTTPPPLCRHLDPSSLAQERPRSTPQFTCRTQKDQERHPAPDRRQKGPSGRSGETGILG